MYSLKKRFVSLLPIVAYVGITAIVFAKVLFPPQGQMLFAPDIWRYHYYTKPFLFQQLSKGVFPLWNPYTFSGMPYIEQPQMTPWYPPMLLFAFLPIAQAFSWYFAFHIFLAMAGMYFFVRSLRISRIGQIGRWPSWIAGVSFGLSGFFVARIYAGHIDIIAASAWLPMVLAMFLRLIEQPTPKRLILAGLFLAIQIFAGYQTIAIFTLEALALLTVFVSLRKHLLLPIIFSVGAVTIGLGIAAVQLLPNAKFVSESVRSLPLPYEWSTSATPTPYHLLELIDPSFFYERIPNVPFGHEHASYIGKLPLLFMVVVFLWTIHKRVFDIYVIYFFLLGFFAWWIALAHYAPFDLWVFLQKTLPFYSQLRIPSRHVLLYVFGASALAGIGFSFIKNRAVLAISTILVLVDLVPFAWQNIHLGAVPELAEDTKLIDTLQTHEELFRYLPAFFSGSPPRENLEFATPMKYELYSVSGYDTPQLRRYIEFLMGVNGITINDLGPYTETIPPYTNLASPFTDFLNIRYIFVPFDQDLARIDPKRFVPRLTDAARGYRLFENTNVLPRFFFVPTVRVLPDSDSILAAVSSGDVDPRQTVLTQKDQYNQSYVPDCPQGAEGTVRVVSYKNSRVQINASSPCNGFLVSSEVMYPGWVVTIDGKKTEVFEGNGAFRSVVMPKGEHTVIFSYRPTIVYLGGVITIFMILVCLVIAKRNTTLVSYT